MKRNVIASTVLALSVCVTPAYAALEAYTDSDLSHVDGQAGIYDATAASISLGLELRLNMDKTSGGVYSNICASGEVACNIGLSFNNRFTATNRKDWLVFKNVTGSINVPEIKISGQNVDISNSTTANLKPALTLTMSSANPIIIKQLGFESLAVETDSQAEVDASGNLNLSNLTGYRVATLAAPLGSATNVFDAGKFTGFIGLDITASIKVNGNIKIFSCTRSATGCS
jgi:hypothetical protein